MGQQWGGGEDSFCFEWGAHEVLLGNLLGEGNELLFLMNCRRGVQYSERGFGGETDQGITKR